MGSEGGRRPWRLQRARDVARCRHGRCSRLSGPVQRRVGPRGASGRGGAHHDARLGPVRRDRRSRTRLRAVRHRDVVLRPPRPVRGVRRRRARSAARPDDRSNGAGAAGGRAEPVAARVAAWNRGRQGGPSIRTELVLATRAPSSGSPGDRRPRAGRLAVHQRPLRGGPTAPEVGAGADRRTPRRRCGDRRTAGRPAGRARERGRERAGCRPVRRSRGGRQQAGCRPACGADAARAAPRPAALVRSRTRGRRRIPARARRRGGRGVGRGPGAGTRSRGRARGPGRGRGRGAKTLPMVRRPGTKGPSSIW